MSFVSQIMRKASIVERSDRPLTEKAESFEKLAKEANVIVDRMESSLDRLSPNELQTLGPGRQKEMAQLTEAITKLRTRAQAIATGEDEVEQPEATH